MSDHTFLTAIVTLGLIIVGLGFYIDYSHKLRRSPREKMDRAMERARRSMSERELDERRRLAKSGFILDDDGLTICMVCGGDCGQCGGNSDHGLTLEEYAEKHKW